MIKGLAITPPVLGRITIGKVVERDGRRLPQKDDEFTITSQIQSAGDWIIHPLDTQLREQQGEAKLRRLPVRMLFSEPNLNLRASYALFDRDQGRPLCMGDGETCRRRTKEGLVELPCPSPDGCELAAGGRCKPFARLSVLIGEQEDPLGSFIFRTTGFNSIRTLEARLSYFQAISCNRLAYLPLELRLRGKSTRQSFGRPIFYVDLTLREGWTLEESLAEADRFQQEREAIGFDQKALDRAAKQCLANGAFEESPEEGAAVAEEFYSAQGASTQPQESNSLSEQLSKIPQPQPASLNEQNHPASAKQGGNGSQPPSS
ncbi:hypothetical protein HH1059_14330 [Halorhodospira halochloris]|uniref:Hydrolase or metal-binding protein n=1 Tax=Halorhodospira halochloris TaxID=1052 RepID=A0A0X8X9V1_HALHR|nr:hydrolase or metal-binding protein [Halorhodospira halochloris]BAU58139.1 hypothetical protein HH1059_14330 [Halorhodospira halochloris]